jgi:hypothetical protein
MAIILMAKLPNGVVWPFYWGKGVEMKKSVHLGIISVLLFSLPVCAEPIFNPNNGHYYERITGTITWVNAKTAAESMS